MDILQGILNPPQTPPDPRVLKQAQNIVKNAILQRQGISGDELDNYNAYMLDLLALVPEHYHPTFIDAKHRMHEIKIIDAYFVRPFFEGMDTPEKASLHGSYEAHIRGTVLYRISVQDDTPETELHDPSTQNTFETHAMVDDTSSVSDSEEEKEAPDDLPMESIPREDWDTMPHAEPLSPQKKKRKRTRLEVLVEAPEDEEDEEMDEPSSIQPLQPVSPSSSAEEEDEEEPLSEEEHHSSYAEEIIPLHEEPEVPSIEDRHHTVHPAETIPLPTLAKPPKPGEEQQSATLEDWNRSFVYREPHPNLHTRVIYETRHENVHLLDLPALLQSDHCVLPTALGCTSAAGKEFLRGGTFLVHRLFKVCPYEETFANNQCLLHEEGKVTIRCKFTDISKKYRTNSTLHIFLDRPRMRKLPWTQPARFMIEIPHERPKQVLPVSTMALAMGWLPEHFTQLVHMFLKQEQNNVVETFLRTLRQDVNHCHTQADALQRVGQCFLKCRKSGVAEDIASYTSFVIHSEILPHLVDAHVPVSAESMARENHRKGMALAEAVAQLIRTSPEIRLWYESQQLELPSSHMLHNKHNFIWKRVVTPGQMITILTRKFLKEANNKACNQLKRTLETGKPMILSQIMNPRMIRLTQAIRNGVFDVKNDTHEANQNKTKLLITGFCSDSTRTQCQSILKVALKKNSEAKRLMTDPGQMGRIDAYLTPQSEGCGIIRQKAMGCIFSPLIDLHALHTVIQREIDDHAAEWGYIAVESRRIHLPCLVHTSTTPDGYTLLKDVWGGVMGWIAHPLQLYQHFIKLRRGYLIYPYLSLYWNRKLSIFTFFAEEDRLLRPLLIMSAVPKLIQLVSEPTFAHLAQPDQWLMEQGCMEYLDAAEEFSGLVLVAESMEAAQQAQMEQTHLEIHMLFHYSLLVAKSHFHMNAGARRMYTGCMQNRTIGLKIFTELGASESHSLVYGQVPLISDPVDEALDLRIREPNGINTILGIVSHDSNMEDACTMSKSAVELGLGLALEYHTYTITLSEHMHFKRPSTKTQIKHLDTRYAHLPPNGIPTVGIKIPVGGAIVGKVISYPAKKNKPATEMCDSKFNPLSEVCTISEVRLDPPHQPQTVCVTISVMRYLEVSNKIQIGHGQKMTIGQLVPREDLPFIESGPMAGTTFDLMINSCSLKRITQGLLLDMLEGQAHSLSPTSISQYDTMIDNTEGLHDRLRLVSHILRQRGFSYDGKALARCGQTGELLQCMLFSGPILLHVLPHRGRTKIRSRERGRTDPLTRQTSSGKKNLGGLRFGEMEAWNSNSHGTTAFSRNAHYTCADKFRVFWCTACQGPAIGSPDGFYHCPGCQSSQHVVRLQVPFTTNLVQQELMTCGYGMRFVTGAIPQNQLTFLDDEAYVADQKKG